MGKSLFKFDMKGGALLARKIDKLGTEGAATVASSLYESAEKIMTLSKENYVPVETGTLRSTGRVDPPRVNGPYVEVTLGYGGPSARYALAVHENPRAGKTYGVSPQGKPYKRWAKTGQWKYLETPVKESSGEIVEHLKKRVNQKLSDIANSGR